MAIDRYVAIHCNKYGPSMQRKRPPRRAHAIAEMLKILCDIISLPNIEAK